MSNKWPKRICKPSMTQLKARPNATITSISAKPKWQLIAARAGSKCGQMCARRSSRFRLLLVYGCTHVRKLSVLTVLAWRYAKFLPVRMSMCVQLQLYSTEITYPLNLFIHLRVYIYGKATIFRFFFFNFCRDVTLPALWIGAEWLLKCLNMWQLWNSFYNS